MFAKNRTLHNTHGTERGLICANFHEYFKGYRLKVGNEASTRPRPQTTPKMFSISVHRCSGRKNIFRCVSAMRVLCENLLRIRSFSNHQNKLFKIMKY